MSHSQGFTLIQVVATMAIATIALFILIEGYVTIIRSHKREAEKQAIAMRSREMALRLKTLLGGSRSFQNISFRFPPTGQESVGPGILVDPDKDIEGNPSGRADMLYLVSSLSSGPEVKVLTVGDDALVVSNGTVLPVTFFGEGDFFVLTKVTHSDMVRLKAPGLSARTNEYQLSLDRGSDESPTYRDPDTNLSASLSAKYLPNDILRKAAILKIGLKTDKNELTLKTYSTRSSSVAKEELIAHPVSDFRISYQRKPCLTGSPALRSASNDFERGGWTALNANPSCYKMITAIKIAYTIGLGSQMSFVYPLN